MPPNWLAKPAPKKAEMAVALQTLGHHTLSSGSMGKIKSAELFDMLMAAQLAVAETERLGKQGSSGCGRRPAAAGFDGAPLVEEDGDESEEGDMPYLQSDYDSDNYEEVAELQPAPAAARAAAATAAARLAAAPAAARPASRARSDPRSVSSSELRQTQADAATADALEAALADAERERALRVEAEQRAYWQRAARSAEDAVGTPAGGSRQRRGRWRWRQRAPRLRVGARCGRRQSSARHAGRRAR